MISLVIRSFVSTAVPLFSCEGNFTVGDFLGGGWWRERERKKKKKKERRFNYSDSRFLLALLLLLLLPLLSCGMLKFLHIKGFL